MALDRFKQALAALLEQAPEDPLARDEYLELQPLPSEGANDFAVYLCDEEHELFALVYQERLFQEGEAGQEAVQELVGPYLERTYGLGAGDWSAVAPFDLGWRSREFHWFIEFSVPGLIPNCRFDA
ncbi:hypothetical protein [Vulcanococcus limneticus]|uniref:hypothetical protein n=1 Tax=Vulcanococcus limneticus TaxID=2170428 RepID=UPI000B99A396|nr:hypothetical protein [Vulcanococcus limneticus]MCP9790715.1 hypothetical protein [Vulcanococcus limneticus MW73D5]MCP9892942.1 hypothetical protein [Vulcanococcus limneticus Candia 3F8]MCP9896323.1 hypothetical protein [Vulcanococcus limneticus Candia 3B3]